MKPKSLAIMGSGVASVAAGIFARQSGFTGDVRLFAKTPQLGAPLRTIDLAGSRVDVGANTFGAGANKLAESLGIKCRFIPVSNRIVLGSSGATFSSPPDLTSLWNIFYPNDFIRLYLQAKKSQNSDSASELVGVIKNRVLQCLALGMLSYPAVRSVEQISVNLAKKIVNSGGDFAKPHVAEFGAADFFEKMLARAKELGVDMVENSVSAMSDLSASDVLMSSDHAWQDYPQESPASLSISMLLLTVDAEKFLYPSNLHTTLFFPDNNAGWLETLERGEFPKEQAFHCFSSLPINAGKPVDGRYVITVYALWPRDKLVYTPEEQQSFIAFLENTMQRHFPELAGAIVDRAFYSPQQCSETFGFESRIIPKVIADPNLEPPPCYKDGIYRIGNGVNGPENQTMAGSINSAQQAVERLKQDRPDLFNYSTSQQTARLFSPSSKQKISDQEATYTNQSRF